MHTLPFKGYNLSTTFIMFCRYLYCTILYTASGTAIKLLLHEQLHYDIVRAIGVIILSLSSLCFFSVGTFWILFTVTMAAMVLLTIVSHHSCYIGGVFAVALVSVIILSLRLKYKGRLLWKQ